MANKIREDKGDSLAYRKEELTDIYTKLLERNVKVEILLPAIETRQNLPLLILNDGQDNDAVKIKSTVEKLVAEHLIPPIMIAGVHAGNRVQEYGVSARKDFEGRGSKSKAYTKFIVGELLPYLEHRYPVNARPEHRVIAGYSLGGLSALDIAWNNPNLFLKVGVFSGSFWWRKRATDSRFYSDNRDRIMHSQIRKGNFKPGMSFWFQVGTNDEQSDRNNNGVIDAIDDTLDLIVELTKKGYRPFHDIEYLEMAGGEHNQKTWSKAMPHFLKWAFGKTK